jgi:putative oxidoreductase
MTHLTTTTDSWAPLVIRIVLGTVLFAHGAQKLLGWFGGYGFTGTMNYFTQTIGLPWILGAFIILFEFAGPILLVFGVGTRVLGLITAILFAGIIYTVNSQYGFFMNWFGNKKGEGFEYALFAIAMAVSLVISGGGKWSVDSLLTVVK